MICPALWTIYIRIEDAAAGIENEEKRMNMDERVRRINELYHKSQAEGLTDAEKEEQAQLRREYVASVRGNLKAQLDNISIQREDGTVERLRDKHKGRKD